MKISWNSLKVSITGARLSHLVQKDSIWDHGTMIEHIKTVFFQLKKARMSGDVDSIRKYMTSAGYEKIKKQMDQLLEGDRKKIANSKIKEVAVIDVMPATNKHADFFTALLKGYGTTDIADLNNSAQALHHDDITHEFSEQWFFVRQGDWWMLNEIKSKKNI
jgi:hypothetical protein